MTRGKVQLEKPPTFVRGGGLLMILAEKELR
jgi:hypothetical protein